VHCCKNVTELEICLRLSILEMRYQHLEM